MRKNLLITVTAALLVFLLASCTRYRYEVSYEQCDGHTGTLVRYSNSAPMMTNEIFWSGQSLTFYRSNVSIPNVCSYS